jgi:bacteriophage N4 adsorption protein B
LGNENTLLIDFPIDLIMIEKRGSPIIIVNNLRKIGDMVNEFFQVFLWICTVAFVLSGIDDSAIDLIYWLKRKKYNKSLPDLRIVYAAKEKSIALIICAWKEYTVIERTINNALNNIKYNNYRIFVGLYPNDTKTIDVVKKIAEIDNRVVVCINTKDGPTTKADNLNNVYEIIKNNEFWNEKEFDIILVHDSEDFIHSNSLKLINYIISVQGSDAVQIPVVPIKGGKGKFIHKIYCDGFAEIHTKDLVVRQEVNAFIPFAGTGMAFKRNLFTLLEEKYGKVFNENNLTEDYELGLKFHKMGFKISFVNMEINFKNDLERIATTEYFPNYFWAAVKQRSRWNAGICFQNWKMHKWDGSLKTKYFLMRDRKTIFSNFMMIISNILLIMYLMFFIQKLFDFEIIPPITHISTTLWILLYMSFAFMLLRFFHRFVFTYNWYGLNYAFLSLVRVLVDNVINFFAIIRAIKVFMQMKHKVVWESTEHY